MIFVICQLRASFTPIETRLFMNLLPDSSPLLLYLTVFLTPFWQEDIAVFGAATAASTGLGNPVLLFFTIWAGLICSDIWKYWIGWGALKVPRFAAYAEKKHVANLREKVLTYPLVALLVARFIPGTRVPTYVAFGYFKINYLRYCLLIAMTALLYISVVFGIAFVLGEVFEGELKWWVMPLVGVGYITALVIWTLISRRKNKARYD